MIEAARVLELVSNTSSYNDKLYLLKKNEHVVGLKEILKFIYNPYIRTCIAKSKLEKGLAKWTGTGYIHGMTTYDLVIAYYTAHNTGSDKDVMVGAEYVKRIESITSPTSFAVEVAKALITQDLKIGITATSLNTVYGKDFIPKIGCMLGTLIEDVKGKIAWPGIVTEKLDGGRRILVKENGVCRFYSRSGHEDTGLYQIAAEAQHLPDNAVYDGELLAIGNFVNCIEQRIATNSLASTKGAKSGLSYNIFDMVPLNEFRAGKSTDSARVRKITLGATLMDKSIWCLTGDYSNLIAAFGLHVPLMFIKPVPILGYVNSREELTAIAEEVWSRGGEGVMLNTADNFYEVKASRSKSLLKVKQTIEMVLPVVGFIEGTGKFVDTLGSLQVEYKGNKVGVGTGFTDADRDFIWANRDALLNRRIELDTFGESKDALGQVSLNVAVFKRWA